MKFLASRELGRLAKWLRILGFDTEYHRDNNKSSFIIKALREDRIVLTRNKIILKDKALKILFIKSEVLKDQLRQVADEFNVDLNSCLMFTRCIVCNKELIVVNKDDMISKVPQYVFDAQKEFCQCPQCNRIYWHGTHWGNVDKTLDGIIS